MNLYQGDGGPPSIFAPQGTWFRNSRFVPDDARTRVSAQLDTYCASIGDHARGIGTAGVNVHVSGSLARAEPAVVLLPERGYQLASDVDLVAVIPDDADGAVLTGELVAALSAQYPDILTTAFAVTRSRLGQVRSLFGRDLWIGHGKPIHQALAPQSFAPPPVGAREFLEVLVHQLAAFLLLPADERHTRPDRFRSGVTFQRSKLVLEALRGLVEPPPDSGVCFTDLMDPVRGRECRRVLQPAALEGLVRQRELSLIADGSGSDVEELVLAVLYRMFRVSHEINPTVALLASLSTLLASTRELLHVFQCCTLLLFLLRWTPPRDAETAARLLIHAAGRLDENELVEAKGIKTIIAALRPADIAEDPSVMPVLLSALRSLRLDYYHYLGPHNFGAQPRLGYQWDLELGSLRTEGNKR